MIYVLIPARDEASTVGLLLWKVRQAFTGFSREYQIIVVNDGSQDASDDVLAPYTRALPLTLLTHREPRGYARSLEELLRAAVQRTDRPRRDLAVTLQADFSDSPEDLVELVKRLEAGADVAVPDRRDVTFPTRTGRFAHRAANALLRRRLGLAGVKDLMGTMRAYRLAVIERLIRQYGTRPFVTGERWVADVGLLARAARHARTIESVEVRTPRAAGARPSRASALSSAWAAVRAAGELKSELSSTVVPETAALEPSREESRPERPRAQAPRERGDKGDGERGARQGRGERGRRKNQRQGAERREKVERDQQPAAQEPVATAEAAESPPAEGAEAGQAPRRKRRRRGRGRGRGRGGNQQGQGPGDSVSSPSAA